MNRTYFLALLVFLLLFAGLVTLRPSVVALSLPLILYILAGLWRLPQRVELKAERSLSAERVKTGDEVTVTLKVSNEGPALEEVLLDDQVPAGLEVVSGSARRLLALPAYGSLTWTYTLRGQRGYYGLRKVKATAGELLGLARLEQDLTTDGQLFILPPVLRLRRVAIQPRRTRIFSGTIPARQGGAGVEFFDVRHYQPGDSPRWINWRATARHPQDVFSNQFEQERAADVGLILDGRRRTNDFGNNSIFEHSVLATAALADAFLNAGNRVGLLFYGRQITWTMPGYGKLQSERILHDLSFFEPGESQSFSELHVPYHLFPSRSQLVLVSPLISEDYDTLAALRMRGYHLLVVSPDPVSFEAAGLVATRPNFQAKRIIWLQRAVLLRRLRGAGIHVVDWDTSQPFEKTARSELEQRLVLPRGVLR
ncbi:MAG: DUF58 domain-containing protein [Anaerolineales bacterium]|jgi:uncharacterized repeat protein (TIGR01451 family)